MKRKPFWELTTNELETATREFDEPFVVDRSRPLTPAERKQWQRAKKKHGPRSQRISISLDPELVKRVNRLAKERQVSRSRVVAEVLAGALGD